MDPAVVGPFATRVLRAIFADATHFTVHDPLPAAPQFGDEGAANHTRFVVAGDVAGVEFFVYGRHAFDAEVRDVADGSLDPCVAGHALRVEIERLALAAGCWLHSQVGAVIRRQSRSPVVSGDAACAIR